MGGAGSGDWEEGRIEESEPDKDGIVTITEYRTDPVSKKRQRVTRKVKRTVRRIDVTEGVQARLEWVPFGQAAVSNKGCTFKALDDIHFERTVVLSAEPAKPSKGGAGAGGAGGSGGLAIDKETIVHSCKYCGGPHSALKCTNREQASLQPVTRGDAADGGGARGYVPPSQRGGAGAGGAAGAGPMVDKTRIRITNLADDATEEDVYELCRGYGRVNRVHITRHRESGRVTGAYVEFYDEKDAEAAKANLDGCGFHYLLLKVDWARPREATGGFGGGGLAGGFVSGYGKALPQSRPGGK